MKQKLSKGQVAVLRHVQANPATMIAAMWKNQDHQFWGKLPGASPSTFHSLVRRGLLRVENRDFHYITEEGKAALSEA